MILEGLLPARGARDLEDMNPFTAASRRRGTSILLCRPKRRGTVGVTKPLKNDPRGPSPRSRGEGPRRHESVHCRVEAARNIDSSLPPEAARNCGSNQAAEE